MNKKVIIAIIIGILFIIFLARYVFYDRYKMPEGVTIETISKELEVYSEDTKIYDLIKDHNVKIVTEDDIVNTREVGDQKVTIEYKYKGIRKYKYDIDYKVIDTTKPIFITSVPEKKSYYVNEASLEDLEKDINKIMYADNYDINPRLDVKGDVDFGTVGNYIITFTLSDSSKNILEKSTNITIKERPVEVVQEKEEKKEELEEIIEEKEDNSNSFEEQIKTYKNSGSMVGIDISKWQGEVDFNKVKEAGCEFVIIRIGVMKDKDSELVKDNTFDANYKNAKAAGLKVGIYVYSEANNVDTAVSNAEFIIDTLKGDKLDFPVAFDWESWTYFNSMEMNLHMLNEMYDAFSAKLEEAGYDTMLYSSQNYLNNVWMDLKDYKIWAARYSSNAPEIEKTGNRFLIWQNSNTGKINGVDGNVDFDIYYKQ